MMSENTKQSNAAVTDCRVWLYKVTQKNGNFWKTQQKLKKSKKKNFIDRNWTITTCLLRDSNPNYQCLKVQGLKVPVPQCCQLYMAATTHFKSSHFFCVTLYNLWCYSTWCQMWKSTSWPIVTNWGWWYKILILIN